MPIAEVRCHVFREEFHGRQLPGPSFSRGNYSGKSPEGKSPGAIALREFHRELSRGELFRSNCPWGKNPAANFLEGNFIEAK